MSREWTMTVPAGWVEDPALSASILTEKQHEAPGARIDVAAYVPTDRSPGAMSVIQITVDYPESALAELENGAHTATVADGSGVEYAHARSGGQLVATDIADQPQGRVYSKRIFENDGHGKVLWVNAQCVGKHGQVPACAEAVKTLELRVLDEPPWAFRAGLVGGTLLATLVAIAMIARTGGSRAASPAPSPPRAP